MFLSEIITGYNKVLHQMDEFRRSCDILFDAEGTIHTPLSSILRGAVDCTATATVNNYIFTSKAFDGLDNRSGFTNWFNDFRARFDLIGYARYFESVKGNLLEETYAEFDELLGVYQKALIAPTQIRLQADFALALINFVNRFDATAAVLRGIPEYTYADTDEEDIIVIQLLDGRLSARNYVEIIEAFEDVYTVISTLTELPNQMEIVKLESGSLLLGLKGAGEIVSVMKKLIPGFMRSAYRAFTTSGQLAHSEEALKIVRDSLKLSVELKELGQDTSVLADEINGAAVRIVKSLNAIPKIGVTTVIVDDEIIRLDEGLHGHFIEYCRQTLLDKPIGSA